jgi:hypothetical protein
MKRCSRKVGLFEKPRIHNPFQQLGRELFDLSLFPKLAQMSFSYVFVTEAIKFLTSSRARVSRSIVKEGIFNSQLTGTRSTPVSPNRRRHYETRAYCNSGWRRQLCWFHAA